MASARGRHPPKSRLEERKDEHPDRRQCLPAHTLELNIRTELTLAETSQPWEDAVRVPIDEWLSDPADDQRYEVGLRSLLGAVKALEDDSGPSDHTPSAEVPEIVITAAHLPDGPGPGTQTEGW